MSGEAMAQGVWVYVFLDTRSLRGVVARMPNHFRSNWLIPAVMAVALKRPNTWVSVQPVAMVAERLDNFWIKHDIPVFSTLNFSDLNHHALAVDILNFQVDQ